MIVVFFAVMARSSVPQYKWIDPAVHSLIKIISVITSQTSLPKVTRCNRTQTPRRTGGCDRNKNQRSSFSGRDISQREDWICFGNVIFVMRGNEEDQKGDRLAIQLKDIWMVTRVWSAELFQPETVSGSTILFFSFISRGRWRSFPAQDIKYT